MEEKVRTRMLELLGDPRVLKVLQSERFVDSLASLLRVPGAVNEFTEKQAERLASSLGMASARRVRELERRVEDLEVALRRLENSSDSA